MDRDVKNEVWLTSVLNDDDVPRALTLCLSLKRVMTSRQIGVIVTSEVSTALREALRRGFDMYFYIDKDRNSMGLKTEDFVKLYAFTLKSFATCVYLAPTMIAIKNCDEIFDEHIGPNDIAVWTQQMNNLSIFMVRPSLPIFEALMSNLSSRNGKGFEDYLRTWTKNQTDVRGKLLKEKFNRLLSPQHNDLFGNESDVSIVNVENIPFDVTVEKFGWFSQLVLEQRNLIFNRGVKPFLLSKFALDSPMNGNINRTPWSKEPIAIVGMSCRYPAANNIEEFWNLLSSGEDGTGTPPDFRWQRANKLSKTLADCRNTNAGFLKTSVEDFDAKFFGISPKEMIFLDPQHRLLHELVWEGLEDAALNPQSLEGTEGGVFIGSWTNEYKDIMSQAGHDEFYRIYMGTSIGAAAARISHLLGLTGPSLATESGCSSAMVAVHLACKSLQRGESSFALACGVNLLLTPFNKDIMPMVLSPDGNCKTFDANADGFARAEGCGVLVLKRLSDAVKDGDNIWAMIKGSAMTQEGISKSMGTPTVHCESLAMTKALNDGNTAPEQVSYVETHGTGTPVGDPMEIASIAKAYHSENRQEPLLIGSVKTNVGHTESCSGITGIMKVVLSMHHELIPAHRNFETLNPAIDLGSIPAQIPLNSVSWPKMKGKPRCAGVSSFGITGTDAHVIIEESPHLPFSSLKLSDNNILERPLHVMKVSTKTEEAMDRLLEYYSSHLQRNTEDSDVEFKNLAYTANVGRADFSHRAIIIAKSNKDAHKIIAGRTLLRAEIPHEAIGKICFLFTGQGSQYPGMAKQLYETSPIFRMHFEHCKNVLRNEYNIDITQVLWSEDQLKSKEVSRTIYSQPSIFCVEYALFKLWESWGVKPDYVLGHSLGEFAAAVCAEILSVEDALKLVAERSRLIDQLPRGKMLVIKADKQVVDSTMRKFASNNPNKCLDYAAVNSDEQTVVAGDSDVVLEFSEYCEQVPLKCIVLGATHAFHSKHMDPMLNDYRTVAKTVNNLNGNEHCKYVSGMRGSTIEAKDLDAEYWVQHTREKVMFKDASKLAVDLGARVFIEIGPQPVLSALTMMNNDLPLVCLPSLKRNEPEWETLFTSLGKLYLKGLEIDWKRVDLFCERNKCRLPTYPFIGKTYWPETVAPSGLNIHPLLGCVIPNACSTKIFQSSLSLRALEYVKDHAIGDNVIFPGAGYLEMCLAAGLATVEEAVSSLSPPSRAMKVENLFIEAPMSLQEGKLVQLQTIVELRMEGIHQSDWLDMKVNIFRNLESDSPSKWLPLAQATFSPIISPEERNIKLDCTMFKETILLPANEEEVNSMYNKLSSLGLKFGPTFRSIEGVWRSSPTSLLAKVKVSSSLQNQTPYIVHPVVLDAMIQAMMMIRVTSNIKRKLYVPIKIGKFVWLARATTSEHLYIHSFTLDEEENGNMSNATAVLLNSDGYPLAIMSTVELIDTTVKAMESVLEQQVISLPDMYEEVWKPKLGSCDLSPKMEKTVGKFYTDEFKNSMDNFFQNQSIERLLADLEKYVYLNFLRGLYDCGWKPHSQDSNSFDEDTLFNELGIAQKHRQYFGFIMEAFAQEGILRKLECATSGTSWKIIQMPPSESELMTIISSAFLTNLVAQFEATLLLGKVGELLGSILRDEQSALTVLFPPEKTDYPSVADFYTEYNARFRVGTVVEKVTSTWMEYAKAQLGDENYILRILEVGSGTGSLSGKILENFESHNIQYEYTYTDISAAFFIAAEKKFEKYSKHMKFAKLNIEEDPLQQGFSPEYFDIVFASDVIHATKDIRQTLQNMRMLMKPHAKLDIQEMTQVIRFCTFCFGLLDGFWRFEDKEIRPKHCTLSKSAWTRVLTEAGFQVNGTFSTINDYHSYICCERTNVPLSQHLAPLNIASKPKTWLIFHLNSDAISNYINKMLREITARQTFLVTAGEKFEQTNIEGMGTTYQIRKEREQDFIQLLEIFKENNIDIEGIVYCWCLSNDEHSQEEILKPFFFLTKAILSVKHGMPPRVYAITSGVVPLEDNDMSHFHSSTIWGYLKAMKSENVEIQGKCIEVTDGRWDEPRLHEVFHELWNLEGNNMIAFQGKSRLIPKLQPHKAVNSALRLPKGIQRFQLILPETKAVTDLQFGSLDSESLKQGEVVVQIKASALNFRDVLSIIKPSDDFKDSSTVGFDFSGVIRKVGDKVTKWNVGDRVLGCNVQGKAMPSHLNLHEDTILKLPDKMSFCEGSTIPAVYVTSVLCLIQVAKIKKGENVLIHTASGGVGLSAIEICKYVGCTVFATAGSKRKQNYLRNLGIQHIFHSRNTNFGNEILEVTNGHGVDVVLNSLTSEGFKEASLKACAKGARFVEMSLLNIWSEKEVKQLRPDIVYTTVDLSKSNVQEWTRLMNDLKPLLNQNIIKPLPYVRFDALNVREAIHYLQKTKHIGKIVCVLPELSNVGGELKPYTPIFNETSSYLITGGIGGIGLVVCEWMLENGAKHVILAARNPPKSNIERKINELNSKGGNVIAVQLDVGNFEQCKDLIDFQIKKLKLPRIKGIMHAAGTLSDDLIINHDWSTLSSVFKTKVEGTLNLHELTKNMQLEHFVLFSSLASLLGTPGQSNHSAANCFEDTFAHYRHSIGLPATSINWGQWGEVGIATEADLPGIGIVSNLQGIRGLEYAMKAQKTQTAVINVTSFTILSKFYPHLSTYLDERIWKQDLSFGDQMNLKSDQFWKQYDSSSGIAEKINVLKKQLRVILTVILKLERTDVIADDVDLHEMGVDSLMFVEIKNSLQTLLGERLTVSASSLKDCNTVTLIVEKLVGLMEGTLQEAQKKPNMEEVNELIREDYPLPDHIRAKVGQTLTTVKEIQTVLITGCTGSLGAYVLKELTKFPQIREIVCLVRPVKTESPKERILKNLRLKKLDLDEGKIRCVIGSVAQPHLGMDLNIWEELSEKIDAVFHCAAKVHHTEHYRIQEPQNGIRAVNITGTKNILEFACEKRLKHVYYASSLLAVVTIDNEQISERWPELGEFDNVTTFAYPITKYVADLVMKQGVERGIPCKVFRLPLLFGESDSGRCSIENNHALIRYMFILKHGVMPSMPGVLPALPVDIAAKESVRLFFTEEAGPDIYNMSNGQPSTDQEFVEVAKKFGRNVDFVEFSEFVKRIEESDEKVGEAMKIYTEVYSDELGIMAAFASAPFLRKWIENGEDSNRLYWSKKITQIIPDFFENQKPTMDYIYKDLLFCKNQGWFEKFGL